MVFITQVTNSNTVGIFDLDKLFNNGTEMGKTENDTDDWIVKGSDENIHNCHCFTFLFSIKKFIYHKTHNHINYIDS